MARRSKRDSPEALRINLLVLINDFEIRLRDEDLRSQVVALIPANHILRDLGSSLISDVSADSASDRILAYMQKYPKTLLNGDELMIVAGISEYARRIRELRVESGWAIASGKVMLDMLKDDDTFEFAGEPTDIKPDSYCLFDQQQDRDAAFRWKVANGIRKGDAGVKGKILEYLRENVGKKITGEELKYLANGKSEWSRRVRELRTEDGWPIVTRNSGMPDLPVGVYLLESDKQAEVHDRRIPDITRVKVLERDSYSCKSCGWSYANANLADRTRTQIELHHIEHHIHGGKNTEENLISLCNICHDDVHRGRISREMLESYLFGDN